MKKHYAEHLLSKTKQDYTVIAKDFSRTRKNPWPEVRFLFDQYLEAGDKALDLGCGNGRFLPFFKENGVDYVGVDNSQRLLGLAKERFPEGDFRLDDALNLSFSDDSFDKVYSMAVLHQIPSAEFRLKFMNEAKRVLKPKGLLVLTVWKFYTLEHWQLLLKYTFQKMIGEAKLDWGDVLIPWGEKTERYYHCFSPWELKGLAEKSGLRVLKQGTAKNKTKTRQNLFLVARHPL